LTPLIPIVVIRPAVSGSDAKATSISLGTSDAARMRFYVELIKDPVTSFGYPDQSVKSKIDQCI
jgi:hypothetical protein